MPRDASANVIFSCLIFWVFYYDKYNLEFLLFATGVFLNLKIAFRGRKRSEGRLGQTAGGEGDEEAGKIYGRTTGGGDNERGET